MDENLTQFDVVHKYLFRLINLSNSTRVHDVVIATIGFISEVERLDLHATREAARRIEGLRLNYGCGSVVLSESSRREVISLTTPLRRVLESEIRARK